MPAEDGGGRNLDREALQATLADLVRAAEESGGPGPDMSGEAVEAPSAPAPRPRIPTVRAPGQKLTADQMPDDPGAMARPAAPRPPAAQPRPSSPMTAQDAEPAPVPLPDGVRPPASGRPRLPFSPGPAPSPQGGPAGTVRPGPGGLGSTPTGGMMGSGVRAPAFGAGLGLGADDDAVMAPRGINSTSGLPGLGGGRITRDQGDNLAKLAPTPTEQPTIALRRRKPADGPGTGAARGEATSPAAASGPGGAHATPAGSNGQAPAPQAARPAVAVEPWVPGYDDILPARSARSGRSFRLRK